MMMKTTLFISLFIVFGLAGTGVQAWLWNSADNVLPSLREELDKEIAAYRQRVGHGMSLHERIMYLDRLIGNYKPLGLNVVELETERTRLQLQEKQERLRTAELQDEATLLYERGVAEYREGQYQTSLETMREAERLVPDDTAIKEVRRRLEGISSVLEAEVGAGKINTIIRLAVTRYLENDPKRAMNALIYASEIDKDRREIDRIRKLVETNHPEIEPVHLPAGIRIVDHKLAKGLEAIYDGRYLTAIAECTDVLDLEPNNVMALTRLGSAYYAMNEQNRALQIWTKALQLDPENDVLKKFLYGKRGISRVEKGQ
jgi:tetratricopeptide (TPR) repeat protein